MEKEYINFKQEREFGDILNATFQFIGQEFKPLGTVILYYALPFIVLASVIMGLFINNTMNWSDIMAEDPQSFPEVAPMFAQAGWTWLLSLLSYLFLLLAVYSYISLYVERGKGNFKKEEVWKKMTQNILPVIGTGIVVTLMVMVGAVFCVIPGIYFAVSLSIVFIILIHEGRGFSHAFSRSFALTKLQWWWTLLLLIVVGIITAIIAGLISIPVGVGTAVNAFHSMEEGSMSGSVFGPFATVYMVFASIVSYLLYTVLYVALSFQYFNLVEISEKPSLAERIAAINKEGENENK